MVRIAQKLKTDKRTKSTISVDVHKGFVILSFNQITLKLKRIEAERIAERLSLATQIQKTHKTPKKEFGITEHDKCNCTVGITRSGVIMI